MGKHDDDKNGDKKAPDPSKWEKPKGNWSGRTGSGVAGVTLGAVCLDRRVVLISAADCRSWRGDCRSSVL